MIALNPDVAHCGAATLVVACQQAGVALRMPLGISDAYDLGPRRCVAGVAFHLRGITPEDIMRDLNRARSIGYVIVALVVTTILPGHAHAGSLTFKVNLQTGVGDSAVPPYITYESPIQDANGDGWDETVLKITLNGSPYNQAMFQVQYTAPLTGDVNVNIGDSRTNDSGGGDAGTQSNDAEVHVGRGGASPRPCGFMVETGHPPPGTNWQMFRTSPQMASWRPSSSGMISSHGTTAKANREA